MFCKNCGCQNVESSKFCKNCGSPMDSLFNKQVDIISKTESDVTNNPAKSTINVFQKLLFLISLLWFIVLFFFIPYNDDYEIVYDTLWSDRSDINWTRTMLEFGLLLIASIFVFHFLKRLNNISRDKYKFLAKREFGFFILLSLSVILPGLVLLCINYITQQNIVSKEAEIALLNTKISTTVTKVDKRLQFWKIANEHHNMTDFDNNVGLFWNYISSNMGNEIWLNNYYNTYNKVLGLPYYIKEEFGIAKSSEALIVNNLKIYLGISSAVELKSYIKENILFDEDVKRDKIKKQWINDSINLRNEVDRCVIYTNSDFRRISLISLLIVFGMLYLVRPFVWFLFGIMREIK